MNERRIAILGSTGSIGTNALQVVREHPGRFRVTALAAGRNVERLAEQVREFRPELVSVADAAAGKALLALLRGDAPRIVHGEEGACEVAAAPGTDRVVAAMVGAAGLRPALSALEAGRDLALANKEALVVAGELMTETARRRGCALLPVDSEHNAVHQCLRAGSVDEVRRVVLTASGGPFRERPLETFGSIRIEEALRHPTWNMGRKVTIDSATLFNKGLELIEARWLFGLEPERLEVLIHPQSLVHSLVEFEDGFTLAPLAAPDMGLPIQYALTYPERLPTHRRRLDPASCGALEFHRPDPARYPCLEIAREALRRGGTAPAAVNAADEIAVDEFLGGRLPFTGIARLLGEVLAGWDGGRASGLEALAQADQEARRRALERCAALRSA